MVSGISASASTIGSNYCGANAVYAAKPPEMTYDGAIPFYAASEPEHGMTDEEVAWMNSKAKYWSILEEVWKTEPSQWSDDIFRRLVKANWDLFFIPSDIKAVWDENFSKKESWRRTEATKRELIKEIDSNEEKFELIGGFIHKTIYGDAHVPGVF